MGTQNKRYGITRDLTDKEEKRIEILHDIEKMYSIEYRRQHGQFATPYELAEEIVRYGISLLQDETISFIEPAFGTGPFCSAMRNISRLDNNCLLKIVGVEKDSLIAKQVEKIWDEVELYNDDFLSMQPIDEFNLLICNPPYVRHHYLQSEYKKKIACLIQEDTGLEISGLAGLYCHFMMHSVKWLSNGAVAGWLVPSEFMDVNYGKILKEFLLNKVHLLAVHRYDPQECKFNDALVSSCIVWFKNEEIKEDYPVKFSFGGSLTRPDRENTYLKSELICDSKWTKYPLIEGRVDKKKNGVRLGDYFTVKRGLATGDNDFFIMTKEEIEKKGFSFSYFKPILPSPRHLPIDEIEKDDQGYPVLKTQYFLLDCNMEEEEIKANAPELWKYLEGGVETTAKKYLCKSRRKWYFQEKREVAPLLCSYMGRSSKKKSPFRFILNHSEAIATNSYLMLYPKDELQEEIERNPDILCSIWNILKDIENDDIESEGRIYGGGLRKIEPRELANVKIALPIM